MRAKLTREELYNLVWSTPVAKVAKELGVSGVALAKRCRRVAVPLPPRGYWAKIAAGQEIPKPPLPPEPTTVMHQPKEKPKRVAVEPEPPPQR